MNNNRALSFPNSKYTSLQCAKNQEQTEKPIKICICKINDQMDTFQIVIKIHAYVLLQIYYKFNYNLFSKVRVHSARQTKEQLD